MFFPIFSYCEKLPWAGFPCLCILVSVGPCLTHCPPATQSPAPAGGLAMRSQGAPIHSRSPLWGWAHSPITTQAPQQIGPTQVPTRNCFLVVIVYYGWFLLHFLSCAPQREEKVAGLKHEVSLQQSLERDNLPPTWTWHTWAYLGILGYLSYAIPGVNWILHNFSFPASWNSCHNTQNGKKKKKL